MRLEPRVLSHQKKIAVPSRRKAEETYSGAWAMGMGLTPIIHKPRAMSRELKHCLDCILKIEGLYIEGLKD